MAYIKTAVHREINRLINRLLLVLKRHDLGVHLDQDLARDLDSKKYLKGSIT